MKKLFQILVALALLGFGGFWALTAPVPLEPEPAAARSPNLENGKLIYHAGGCISCHAPGPGLDVAADVPAGGKAFATPIGTLYPPNLTPDPETGLGHWKLYEFDAALRRGLHRDGSNLIPAFPYLSYRNLNNDDVADLFAYLQSLAAVKNQAPPHDVWGLALIRRGLKFWKWQALAAPRWQADPAQSENWNRGAYLVNGPGHCQECHTPRNLAMMPATARAFQGGPHPDGKGKVPSLRGLVERGRYKDEADLVSAFQNGEALGYEHIASGGMGEVQSNLAKLPEADLKAMATYLFSLK